MPPGRRSGALLAVLTAFVSCCASESGDPGETNAGDGAYPADSTGNPVEIRTEVEQPDPLFVLDTTLADLQRVIEAVRTPRTGSGCGHWTDPDSQAGVLVPLPGTAWLLVGDRGDVRQATSEWSIRNLQRKYPVIRFTRSGAPLTGEIVLMVREADAEAERRCVGRLRGVVVRWLNRASDLDIVEGAGTMVVREVRFARAAVTSPTGDLVATGDTIVQLSLTESWISMARREMEAQRWGIVGGMVGGVLLAALMFMGGRAVRGVRKLRVLNRSGREESVEDGERQNEEDEAAANA